MSMSKVASPHRDGDTLDEIVALARGLNLTSWTKEELKVLLERGEREGLSYSDFARRLVDVEVHARRDRKMRRILRGSRLEREPGNLDDFDFSARPKLRSAAVRELLECRWVEEARNVICIGRPGLGKTRVARALGRAACEKGFDARYVVTAELLEELQASVADGSQRVVLRRYEKPAVQILDEFGYEPFDARATNFLFRLVSARHRRAPIIVATNTGFRTWQNIFPSEAQAMATIDRLLDNASILHFSGKTWRGPRDGSIEEASD
jgi:DNA replication protein DnaC